MSSDQPQTVELRWSEVRWYRARVPVTDLAAAVGEASMNPGHPLPADLTQLEGDPFDHGSLNDLLCDLESSDTLTDVDGIEVTSIRTVDD